MSDTRKSSVKIGVRAFLLAGCILLLLIIVSDILTRILPPGEYERIQIDGRTSVVDDSFTYLKSDESTRVREALPIWRWFTAPIEVLWGENGLT